VGIWFTYGSSTIVAMGSVDIAGLKLIAECSGGLLWRPMVFGPRTVESISPAPWRWHRPSTSQGGSRTARASSVRSADPPRRAALTRHDSKPRHLRRRVAEADGDAEALLRSALDVMADELPNLVSIALAPGGLDPWRECFRVIQAREVWINYRGFMERHHPNLGAGIRERMAAAGRVSDCDVKSARRERANGYAAWPSPGRSSVFRLPRAFRRYSPHPTKISNPSACALCA